MTDRARVRLLRTAAALGGALALTATGLTIPRVGLGTWFSAFSAFIVLISVFFSVFTWLFAGRQSNNPVVWTMASAAFFLGVTEFGATAAWIAFDVELSLVLEPLVPSSLPRGAAMVLLFTGWTWVPGFLPLVTYGLLLFPDGKLPSPRWRWVGFLAAVGIVITAVSSAWSFRPTSTSVVENSVSMAIGFAVVGLAAMLSLAALWVRLRRSSGEARQQIKWVLWGASIMVVTFMGPGFVLGGTELQYLLVWPAMIAEVAFLSSYGIAVGKYRLYDVDVVISRTFVFGSLAVFIGAVYVGIVVGVSALFGAGQPNVWLGIGATVIIAIAFQPLRRRLERVANRMVYGRRATPYEVLSSFSQSVSAVDPAVLGQVARSLAEGTTATAVSILGVRGEDLYPIASWPEETGGGDVESEISHDGERLGVIRLTLPSGQTFLPTDEELLDKVSSGLGLALRNLQLTDDLRARVNELRESRRRIVSIQDKTRQKLERDLHDGAQQRLVALKIKIGISESMAQKAGLDDVAQVLTTVKDDADMTIDSLRTLARGIYPPLLEAEGLGPALSTQLHRQPIPVTVQAAGVRRHPREIEATVYFCVLEAAQNSIRHAQAQSVLVTLTETNGDLVFDVRDDGIGFDLSDIEKGPGLTNIGDRVDALGGTLDIDSTPGAGTRITATIPTHQPVPA